MKNDKKRIKSSPYTFCVFLAAAFVIVPVLKVWNGANSWPLMDFYADARMGTAVASANFWSLSLFPVAGWLKAAVCGILDASAVPIVLGFGATAAYVGSMVIIIMKTQPDFL